MRVRKDVPKHIRTLLEAKGYYSLSHEELVQRGDACLKAIFRSSKGDARAEIKALREIRGEFDD